MDVLKAPSLLSLTLQDDHINIVDGIKNLLKAVSTLKSLAKQESEEWPTVKTVLARIEDKDGEKVYQGTVLKKLLPVVPGKLLQIWK